jgi:hypothetical protein
MPRLLQTGATLLLIVTAIGQPTHAAAAHSSEVAAANQEEKKAEAKLTVQVKGRVVDRNGKGLASIEVTAEGPKGAVTKRTGATGAYSFEGPPGKYKITAKAGAKTATVEADVSKSTELQALVLNIED